MVYKLLYPLIKSHLSFYYKITYWNIEIDKLLASGNKTKQTFNLKS